MREPSWRGGRRRPIGWLLRGLGNSSICFVVWVLRWWAWEDGMMGGGRTLCQWRRSRESNNAASTCSWSSSRPIKPSVNLTESVRPLNTSTKLTPQRYHPAKLTTLTTKWLQNSGGAQWLPVGCLVTWIWLESPVRVSGTTTMMGDRGGGRKNKENVRKFSMLRNQHDHVMSEFQRT